MARVSQGRADVAQVVLLAGSRGETSGEPSLWQLCDSRQVRGVSELQCLPLDNPSLHGFPVGKHCDNICDLLCTDFLSPPLLSLPCGEYSPHSGCCSWKRDSEEHTFLGNSNPRANTGELKNLLNQDLKNNYKEDSLTLLRLPKNPLETHIVFSPKVLCCQSN